MTGLPARFDPVEASREIADRYKGYLETTFYFRDPELRASFESALRQWQLVRGPYLEATPVYRRVQPVAAVLADVLGRPLDEGFARAAVGDRPLFAHQEQAIRRLAAGRNVVVATGTGSGKTEAYLLPILLHLMREQETGGRSPGVRALILYPMNALANDQRRRLGEFEEVLERVESQFRFTFGRYTGESPEDARDSRRKAGAQLASRLPGEFVLREEMRATPPDILLSNYSMLEYLLLRPKETPLFDDGRGAHWRFLVLDEAHQYRGAKGMEIAMLLRRLKRRVREGGQTGPFQCIATSASLGGDAGDRKGLAAFASELFEEEFQEEDVITGDTEPFTEAAGATFRVSPEALLKIADHVRNPRGEALRDALGQMFPDAVAKAATRLPGRALLHHVFSAEQRSAELRRVLARPREIEEVGAAVFSDVAAANQPSHLSALVDVLVAAQDPRSQAPLLASRYHLFLRGLEGAFLRHWPRREVTLYRGSGAADEAPAFELALCRECGQHYITGSVEGEHLVEARRDEGEADFKIQFYRPLDDEEDASSDQSGAQDRILCTRCGRLSGYKVGGGASPCGHTGVLHVRLEDERRSHEDQVRSCGRCGYRAPDPVREVTHGTDGPNAVIATSLHRLLPEGRRKVLAFADGRQEAAFFAWYLAETYESIQGRVVVLEALRRVPSIHAGDVGLHDLALEVREVLKERGAERPLTDREWLQKAWIYVFRELLSDQPRISLEGVGLVRWFPHLPRGFALPPSLSIAPWNLAEHEAEDLVRLMLDSFRTGSALQLETGEKLRIGWEDLGLTAKQTQFSIGSGPGATSWDGARTGRATLLGRLLQARPGARLTPAACQEAAQQALRQIWESLAACGGVLEGVSSGKRALPRWWRAGLLGSEDPVHRCDVCGRMQTTSLGGICARYGCRGRLSLVREVGGRGDHYRALYSLRLPPSLRAEEHTAQIEREKAREFQEAFEAGRIHLLSCSTTFELGIDLGNLDTIFLRNVPPEPFNYAQRVGRAGRRAGHPGFAVTYCRRRPHDQTAFTDPTPLLAGRAAPPQLALTNDKIVLRHLVAVALAAYFARFRERFDNGVAGLLGDMLRPTAVADVQEYLGRERGAIQIRLGAVIPGPLQLRLGVTDGTWIEGVCGRDSALARAVAEVADDYRKVAELQQTFVDREDFGRAKWAKARKDTIAGEDVISFLSRKAVIPKYGFPVDVVELDLQATGSTKWASTVALQRDLSIAVAEFAPGAELVANKRLWRSRGLKRVAGRAWPRSAYRKCRVHGTFRSWPDGEDPPSDACCDRATSGRWVDPIFGFVADPGEGEEPQGRPRRLATSRPYFQGVADPEDDPAPIVVGGVARVWRSSPGQLVVLSEGQKGRGFRICGECGAGLPGTATPKPLHESPEGNPCGGRFDLVALGHQFVTDVLRVQFEEPLTGVAVADRLWFHHSLAYAMVHGASAHLEIPRDDLGVTVSVSGPSSHAVVLYDAVPGGAGLVARLDASGAFKHMIELALARVSTCPGCGPDASCYGCLRNYGNQFAHPKLKRGPVAKFLDRVLRSWRGDDPPSHPSDGLLDALSRQTGSAHAIEIARRLLQHLHESGKQTFSLGDALDEAVRIGAASGDALLAVERLAQTGQFRRVFLDTSKQPPVPITWPEVVRRMGGPAALADESWRPGVRSIVVQWAARGGAPQ